MSSSDHDNARAQWVSIASFSTGLEADIARDALELEDIPVLVHSNAPGIFGMSYQGAVAGGVTLHVPTPEEERAREILRSLEQRRLSLVDDDVEVDGNRDRDIERDG